VKELDRDRALQQHLFAAVHARHAALAEELVHLVAGEPRRRLVHRHRAKHNNPRAIL
jgi:hypothetical protein